MYVCSERGGSFPKIERGRTRDKGGGGGGMRFVKKPYPLRAYKSMPFYGKVPNFGRFEKRFFFSITCACTYSRLYVHASI